MQSPIKARGEFVDVTERIALNVTFSDPTGAPTNTDTVPSITIMQPSGSILLGPTSSGVMQIGTGQYSYIFTIPYGGPYGVWNDIWNGIVNGNNVQASFSFVVANTEFSGINQDGYINLGDDPGFDYSQNAIRNINKLLKTLKARLNSSGKAKSMAPDGTTIYVDCDIFSISMLVTFIANAITMFNELPYFTFYTFEDTDIIDLFHNTFVEGAVIQALASQALIERGREYALTDNGISFVPPTVSELLNTEWGTAFTAYQTKLTAIKASIRPHPMGLGNLRMGANTAFLKLRHLRQRRII
jgi:hypothetical protein